MSDRSARIEIWVVLFVSLSVGVKLMAQRKLATNEVRPMMRGAATALAILCWIGVLVLGYSGVRHGHLTGDLAKTLLGVFVLACLSIFVAIQSFAPPWLLRLIPYADASTVDKRLGTNDVGAITQ